MVLAKALVIVCAVLREVQSIVRADNMIGEPLEGDKEGNPRKMTFNQSQKQE